MLRPRSIIQLVLVGFGVVTIPLLAAFIVTALSVSELSRTGEQAILQAADIVQESRNLARQAEEMERNGRQYLVLEDPALLDVYLQRRSLFQETVNTLQHQLEMTKTQRSLLEELEKLEGDLHAKMVERNSQSAETAIDPSEFTVITSLARGVLNESGKLITTNIRSLSESANRVHRLLLWETVALVPLAIGLGGVFVFLIIRPLRGLNAAIHRLGAGRFDDPVTVTGPRDLQQLGKQLEWMRQRLLELENQKALFLRNISHELKTPLTTLREGTQLLGEGVVGVLNPEQQEIVTLLRQNSIQLQQLIEDLLQFSVSQTAPLHVANKPVELVPLIERALAEQRLPAQSKRLSIKADLAPIVTLGDQVKLKAVFGNLVSNAIKFSPSDSPVRVKLTESGPWAEFEIMDCGPGIDDTDRNRVFEAFYQGRASYTGHVKGSGLGLSIAKEFVRLHRGTIDVVESSQGARIRVRLPLAENSQLDSEAGASDGGTVVGHSDDDGLREPGTDFVHPATDAQGGE